MADMPKDWNDHEGWEKYYASLYPNGEFLDKGFWTGSISLDSVEGLANELMESKSKTIWFSGCGISLLPKALARKGFEVFATDISATAIEFQKSLDPKILEFLNKNVKSEIKSDGTVNAEIHDFRNHFRKDFFDLVVNVKSFQGFDENTMNEVAQTHYDALKPNRNAIFDTMNVQGERRDIFEESLVKAGFLIPFYELNRWYRNELNKTKIPYVFVLGNPHIPRFGEYANNEEKVDKDTKILRDIAADFYKKQQETLEDEKTRLNNPNGKIASIIYSTG